MPVCVMGRTRSTSSSRRSCRPPRGSSTDGRSCCWGTNNYLGLTFDETCIDKATEALHAEGTGTTGSRMANGTYSSHKMLEQKIANFFKREAAMLFTTGFQANLGMLASLAGAGGPSAAGRG